MSEPAIQVVGSGRNGEEALALAEELKPDVITLDLEMPVMDGLETLRVLMARNPIPVLMLSGKYDSGFPLELSQKPFFRLLGTPPAMKRHVLDEGGHFLPRPMMVREALGWLDRYLGPVQRR